MNKKRCLITWWGALARGGETIGDLYAVVRTCRLAEQAGYTVSVGTNVAYRELREFDCVQWDTLAPGEVDLLLFVCGPLIGESTAFAALMARYAGVPSMAVGVSVLTAPDGVSWNPFDVTIARDGIEPCFGDMAGFRPQPPRAPQVIQRIGLCLRQAQREYGADASLHDAADELVRAAINMLGGTVVVLDTRLHGQVAEAQAIEHAFEAVDLVITTRMHGGLLSLAKGKPTLAIDQVRDGAKVRSVLGGLGWPVMQAGVATAVDVADQVRQLRADDTPRRIAEFQRKACNRHTAAETAVLGALQRMWQR